MFIFPTAIWITLVLLLLSEFNYDNDGKTINMFITHIFSLAVEKNNRNNPVNLVLLRKEFFFKLVKISSEKVCAQ